MPYYDAAHSYDSPMALATIRVNTGVSAKVDTYGVVSVRDYRKTHLCYFLPTELRIPVSGDSFNADVAEATARLNHPAMRAAILLTLT